MNFPRTLTARARACRIVLPLLLLLPLVACGKKGPPKPPIKVLPLAITDLTVRQEGRKIVVTFTAPTTMTTGVPIPGIQELIVLRRTLEEPPAQEVSEEDDDEDGNAAPRDRFMPSLEFLSKAEPLARLTRADVSASTGGRLEVVDDLATEPIGGVAPNRLYYGVLTIDVDERESDLSNVASIVPLPPPEAARDLKVTMEGSSVKLEWSPPTSGKAPAGYNVYRQIGTDLESAVSFVVVKETRFTDPRPVLGSGVTYRVRSTATSTKPFVESEKAAEATVDLKDSSAPQAPTKLRVASGPSRLEVYWERSTSTDVVGYNVYRASSASGSFTKLTDQPVPETVYVDGSAEAGATHVYAVAAVDGAGNESERSETASGRR